MFNNENGDCLKVNGVSVTTNEFTLPARQSHEFKFIVTMSNRGLVGMVNKLAGKPIISYGFERDKVYLIRYSGRKRKQSWSRLSGRFYSCIIQDCAL